MYRRHLIAGLSLLLSAIASTSLAIASKPHTDDIYTVGIVPQFDSRQLFRVWRPILDAVSERTGLRFRIRGAPSIPEFEKEFLNGTFDFAYMNPYHMLLAHNQQQYVPLVRDHGSPLYGVLIVQKNSAINHVQELAGKTVVFPAPNALGASLLMRAELTELYGTNIKPRYVRTHSSVYLNVALAEAAAGGGVQHTWHQQPQQIQDSLRVLYETRRIPPHPFAAHPSVPEVIQQKIKQALLDIGHSEQGRALLAKIPITKIGPASLEDYQPLGDLGLDNYYMEE